MEDAAQWKDKIDVMILCGGSATDLPEQTPEYARMFNVIDSFDTHARIPEHFANVDAAAKESGKVGIISVGWDPGMSPPEPPVCKCDPSGRKRLYILGQGRQPGSFRRHPQSCRSERCETVYDPGRVFS